MDGQGSTGLRFDHDAIPPNEPRGTGAEMTTDREEVFSKAREDPLGVQSANRVGHSLKVDKFGSHTRLVFETKRIFPDLSRSKGGSR